VTSPHNAAPRSMYRVQDAIVRSNVDNLIRRSRGCCDRTPSLVFPFEYSSDSVDAHDAAVTRSKDDMTIVEETRGVDRPRCEIVPRNHGREWSDGSYPTVTGADKERTLIATDGGVKGSCECVDDSRDSRTVLGPVAQIQVVQSPGTRPSPCPRALR
jgi:hypothetical protein